MPPNMPLSPMSKMSEATAATMSSHVPHRPWLQGFPTFDLASHLEWPWNSAAWPASKKQKIKGLNYITRPGELTKSYWKWPFIVYLPIKKLWLSIIMLVYQRVTWVKTWQNNNKPSPQITIYFLVGYCFTHINYTFLHPAGSYYLLQIWRFEAVHGVPPLVFPPKKWPVFWMTCWVHHGPPARKSLESSVGSATWWWWRVGSLRCTPPLSHPSGSWKRNCGSPVPPKWPKSEASSEPPSMDPME